MSETMKVGRYLCHRRIGAGGMAEIFQARLTGPRAFEKEVAIKLMHRHLAGNSAMAELFVNEARITATLDHPNIVTLFELDEHEGRLFLVMELVDGLDLATLLERLGRDDRTLDWDLALAIGIEIARALQFLHACLPARRRRADPVVHRDLSPGNIMISRAGSVKLLDFGVAKTLPGEDVTNSVARGKWHYMSPEQVRGERLDGRSDLFSLGAVLFEMLTGRQAFKGQTAADSMRKVERAEMAPAPDLEPVLEELLTKLLARDRELRYEHASEALEAMAQTLMLRGKITGERQLAELISVLDRATRPAVKAAARGPLVAAVDSQYLGVGDQSDIHTIPQHSHDGRAGESIEEAVTAETTLPTLLGSGLARRRGLIVRPGEAVGGVSDDQITNPSAPRSRVRRGPSGRLTAPSGPGEPEYASPGRGSLDHLPGSEEPTELLAPEETGIPREKSQPAEENQGNIPELNQAPSAEGKTSIPRVYFDHFMPAEDVQEVQVSPRIWSGRNLLVLVLALLAILIAAVAVIIAIGQRRSRSRAKRSAPPDAATSSKKALLPGAPSRPGQTATDAGANSSRRSTMAASRGPTDKRDPSARTRQPISASSTAPTDSLGSRPRPAHEGDARPPARPPPALEKPGQRSKARPPPAQ